MACEANSVDRLSFGAFAHIVATQDPRHVRQAAHYVFHAATVFFFIQQGHPAGGFWKQAPHGSKTKERKEQKGGKKQKIAPL